ncbi:hypothetical protein AMAG_08981, partial [Allomyces macrogynus ATCC 38327]
MFALVPSLSPTPSPTTAMTDLGAPVAAAVAAASSVGSSGMSATTSNFPDPTVEDVPDSGENSQQGQTDVTIEPSADAMDLDDPPPSTTPPPRRKRRPRRGDLLLFVVHGMGPARLVAAQR